MKHKAVLFDLDGTLLDTIADLTDSMNAALEQLGFSARSVDECKLFVGDGVEAFARRALPDDRRDETMVARCVQLMRDDYVRRWAAKTRPYDGVPELLDGLVAGSVATAVLSNKPDDFTKQMVSHFFDGRDFRIVLGARPDVPVKPAPTAALEIASQLQLVPADFLYLGDTNTDMQTANAAGMFAVGALWGFRPAEELAANGARALIKHPTDLLELL